MPEMEIPFYDEVAEVKLNISDLIAVIDTDTIQIKFKTKIPKPGMSLDISMVAQYIFTIQKPETRTTQNLRVDVTVIVPKTLLQIEDTPTKEQIINLEKKGWILKIEDEFVVLTRTNPNEPFLLSGLGLATGALMLDVQGLREDLKNY
jgi:hypothetical protein